MLIWLYFLAISVLIGAALNSAVARLWPVASAPKGVRARTKGLIEEQVAKVRSRVLETSDRPYDQEDLDSLGASHVRPQGERTPARLTAADGAHDEAAGTETQDDAERRSA